MRIKKFNELKASTYWSAANKLDDIGHKKRAKRLKKWASLSGFYKKPTEETQSGFEDVDNFEFNCYLITETWKNGKKINYKTKKKFVGKVKMDFHSFEWNMTIDSWIEYKPNNIFINPCFLFEDESVFPFSIKMENGNVKVHYISDFGETSLNDMMPFETIKSPDKITETKKEGMVCFSNRKDAVRFLKLWEHPYIRKDFNEDFENYKSNVDDLKEGIVKMFSKLKPNLFYTEEE